MENNSMENSLNLNSLYANLDSENEDFMSLVIVNVTSGCDIVESILEVARRGNTSLAIQSGSGTIASVTLSDIPHGNPYLKVHGPFNLLSLTGSYFYNHKYTLLPGATHLPPSSFGIHLSTSDGHVFGGNIGGPVIAYKDVNLAIFTFRNPIINKDVSEDDEDYKEEDEEDDKEEDEEKDDKEDDKEDDEDDDKDNNN